MSGHRNEPGILCMQTTIDRRDSFVQHFCFVNSIPEFHRDCLGRAAGVGDIAIIALVTTELVAIDTSYLEWLCFSRLLIAASNGAAATNCSGS